MKIVEVYVESKPNLGFQGKSIGLRAILEGEEDIGAVIQNLSRFTQDQALLELGIEPRDLAATRKALALQAAVAAKKAVANTQLLADQGADR